MEKRYLINKYKSGRPFDINHYYPFNFSHSNVTQQQLDEMLTDGGAKGLYKDMSYMFQNCTNLTSIPLLDTRNVTSMSWMFENCYSLTTIPNIDTRNVTSMYSMFRNCYSLTTIPNIDTRNVTSMYSMFNRCSNIETIHMININANLDISPCVKMQRSAIVEVINNLVAQSSGTKTLTLGSTLKGRITSEDIAIATNKGWTIV